MNNKETSCATVRLSKENCKEETKTKVINQRKVPNYYQYRLCVCASADEIEGRGVCLGWECYCVGLTMELVYSVYLYMKVLLKVGLYLESFFLTQCCSCIVGSFSYKRSIPWSLSVDKLLHRRVIQHLYIL
jgi:hypothetical protein